MMEMIRLRTAGSLPEELQRQDLNLINSGDAILAMLAVLSS